MHMNFLFSWKEAKLISLPKRGKNPELSQNLRQISFLSTTAKMFEKALLRVFHRHIEECNIINQFHFGFRPRHRKTLQYIRLTDDVTFIFNKNLFTADVS